MLNVMRYLVMCLCIVSLAGCANMSARQKGFAKGAAVGAVIGGGSGALIGNQVDDSNRDSEAAIGAVAGALIGGTIGALFAKEEPAPAPPSPKAEPAPEPRPAPPPAPVKPIKEKIVLRGINFDFDKYNIKPEFQPVLDEAAEILARNPKVTVIIEGHADSIGTEAYNQRLSERRADSAKRYLVGKGIDASRLETVGYGELRPIASNSTAEGRAMNRRVEFKVCE